MRISYPTEFIKSSLIQVHEIHCSALLCLGSRSHHKGYCLGHNEWSDTKTGIIWQRCHDAWAQPIAWTRSPQPRNVCILFRSVLDDAEACQDVRPSSAHGWPGVILAMPCVWPSLIDGGSQILFCRTLISGRMEFKFWLLDLLIKSPRKVSTRWHLRWNSCYLVTKSTPVAVNESFSRHEDYVWINSWRYFKLLKGSRRDSCHH